MNIYASNVNCLSETTTRLVGLLPPRAKMPGWFLKAIQVQRYARAGDGRIYALLDIDLTQAWADVVTGTLFRATDGASWSSAKFLDVASMIDVSREDVARWSSDAFERGRRRH